jgi:hypothetical protein
VEGLLTAALLISSALILSRGEDGLSSVLRLGLSVGFLALAVFLGFRLLRSITAAERRPSE